MRAARLGFRGVHLRPLDLERDLEVMHEIFGDPAEMTFMLEAAAPEPEQTRAMILRWAKDKASPQWAITEDGTAALGRVTLIAKREGVVEIGVQVAPKARRRGLATRAVSAVTAYGLGRGLVRIYADIDPNNKASIQTFKSANYKYEGTLIANWTTHIGVTDSAIYAATTGWRASLGSQG